MQALFARHRTYVYRWLLRFVSNETLAEDLLSEFFSMCGVISPAFCAASRAWLHATGSVSVTPRAITSRLAAVAGLENLPDQSCRWYRGNRPLRATDDNA